MIGGRLRQRLRGGDSSNRHASPGRRRGSVQTNQGVPRQQSSGSASALESSQHSATEVSLVCTVVDEDGDVNVFTAEGHRLVLRVTTAATAAGTEPQMCYDNIAALQYHPSDAAAGELCVYFSGDNEVYYSLSMPAGGLRLQLARLQRLAAHCGVEFADLSAVADAGEDDALNGGGSPQDTAPTLDLVPPVTARAGSLTPPASLTPDAEQQPVLPVTSSLSVTSRRQSVHPSHAALLAAAGWLRGCGVDARVDEAAVFLAAEGFCTDEDMALLTEGDLLASGLRRCDVRRVLAALASRAAVPAAGPLVDDSAFDRKGPRVVQVGFTINQVSSIDTVGAAFTVAYKVFYVWLEPDLLGRKAEEVNWDEIWTPRGYIKNALDAGDVERRVRAYDIATGGTVRGRIMDPWVIETVRYRSTMSQPMALEDFPVDRQELTICVTTRNHGKKVEFRPAVVENILESQALAGWAFPTFRTHFDMSQPDNTGKRYPEFHITVEAQRIVRFYLVNICAQLSLLSTTTFFTVAIGPSEFSDRTQLTVTMLLTAITFKMSVSEWMPRIGYLTILDKCAEPTQT
eukprot:TRINITY_DN18532_c0_g1_i3.p1 TRINITY_DN18532_c0_g1~~TRINITY_DN18532_c0_g1_i3.p1  ORF type:complete len:572 (+),score=167.00 TRINITY_DN18532_c0_g1_i3:75-1790(+)